MFYQTQVSKVIAGGVIDVQGKSLSLIGNKLVKQGDFVWTDGNVVFGHTPIRGGCILHSEPSGIPILANSMRGYFNLSGVYKPYHIKGDEWIVNNKNTYAHENSGEEIIDADIADDGELLTAVIDSKTQKENFPTIFTQENNLIDIKDYNRGEYDPDNPSWQCSFSFNNLKNTSSYHLDPPEVKIIYPDISFVDSHFAKYDEQIYKTCKITIKRDNQILETIDTNVFVEEIVNKSIKDFLSIKIDNTTIEEHTALLLQWLSFKLKPDGSWQALINLEIWAERGFHGNNTPLMLWSTSTYEPAMLHLIQLIRVDQNLTYEILLKQQTHYPVLFYTPEEKQIPSARAQEEEYESWIMEERGNSFPWEFHYPNASVFWGDGTVTFSVRFVLVFDSRLLNSMQQIDEHVDQFDFPIQDSAVGIFKPSGDKKWQLAEIKYKDTEKSIILSSSPQNSHKKNWCFIPFQNTYLVGYYGGSLYKLSANNELEQIADGLKNFRLRQLNPISKAKK